MKNAAKNHVCIIVLIVLALAGCAPAASIYVPAYPVYEEYHYDYDVGFVTSGPYPYYYVYPGYGYYYHPGYYLYPARDGQYHYHH